MIELWQYTEGLKLPWKPLSGLHTFCHVCALSLSCLSPLDLYNLIANPSPHCFLCVCLLPRPTYTSFSRHNCTYFQIHLVEVIKIHHYFLQDIPSHIYTCVPSCVHIIVYLNTVHILYLLPGIRVVLS